MASKILVALVTVLIGIGVAFAVYWLLNKFAELLPGRAEHRVKPYLYILPAYLAITLYLIYPAIQTIIDSFRDQVGEDFVGFENYQELLSSDDFRATLYNTFLWILIVPVGCVVMGLAVATLADRLSARGENAVKTMVFLPMAISLVGASVIWNFVYEFRPAGRPQVGLWNAIIGAFGFDPVAWLEVSDLHFNSLLLMVVLLWSQVGFSMVLLSAAVKGVPTDTLEAARIDGAAERQIFFQVVVPQIKGTIITVYVTVTIGTMKIFDIVYTMTNGRFNTNVVGNEFWNQLNRFFNNGSAAAIVVMLMIAVIPIMIYQVRHFKAEEANA